MNYTLSDYREIVSEGFDIFDERETKKHKEKVDHVTREMLLAGNTVLANMIRDEAIDMMDMYCGTDNFEEQCFYMNKILEILKMLSQTGYEKQRNEIVSEMNDMLSQKEA